MGLSDTLFDRLLRLPFSALFPRLEVGFEGKAERCTYGHPIVFFLNDPIARTELHLDVSLFLWNKTQSPVTVFDLVSAEAAGQVLRFEKPGYRMAFEEATLEAGGRRVEQDLIMLQAPAGEALRVEAGGELEMRISRSRGRPLRVRLPVVDPPPSEGT